MNKNLKIIILAGMFTAIGVVLKFLGVPISFMGALVKELNFSTVAIMLCGAALGPIYGGLCGAATDVIGFLANPMGAYIPWFTLTNMLFGVIPGVLYHTPGLKSLGGNSMAKSLTTVGIVQLLVSGLLNSYLLVVLFGVPAGVMWARMLGAVILAPIFGIIFHAIHHRVTLRFMRPANSR